MTLYPYQISTWVSRLLKFEYKRCNFECFHQPNSYRVIPITKNGIKNLEAVAQRCSVKKLTSFTGKYFIGVSFLIKLQSWGLQINWKRHWLRCSHLTVEKILRTPCFREYFRWLFLEVFMLSISLCEQREAITQSCSVKKVFLEISQNS